MVQLFLQKPVFHNTGDEDAVKERLSLLQRLESIIWSVITSGGRYEACLWLCNTISCIHSISPRDQHHLFLELLQSKWSRHDVAAQLLQMIFEKRPEKVGPIIAKKSYMLEKFFEGNPERISQWFDNFAIDGESAHIKGARAISQFAFVNRDICWEELEWKGKHGQAPAIVATKPHYFLDLDVLRTVENFLQYVPDFWSSDELADSVKDGKILSIDTKFFVEQFLELMYEVNSKEMWAVIGEFIMEEQFSFLSKHILVLLDERRLLAFLKSIGKVINVGAQCKDFLHPSCWLENLLAICEGSLSLDELLLLNAVIVQTRQLLRLIGDEEHVEAKSNLEEILRTSTFDNTDHWALMKACVEMKQQVAVRWIGLQSWIVHYYLSREYKTPQSWESLFITNQISFRKGDEYSFVGSDGISVRCGSDDYDNVASYGHKKRKRERKKKKKKKYCHGEESNDEMLEFQTSGEHQISDLEGRSWFLSTDGYSCSWDLVDLPEHLSRHCFSTWMKWVGSKW